ncbi:MAG: 2-C-methyl-D-erythritol 2,4-cyclodiphosphate synthase [Phycisphaerales bacterium]|nr:2-C-methyl-D-erythritol 2,4-cyclodiphosphate synthase [Phycisphaerales bacterium]
MPNAAHSTPNLRIGHGYDLHRLELNEPQGGGRPFILGGVRLEHTMGPVAHSDGDAVYHAVVDAILGALGKPDIGQSFPDTEAANKNADSARFMTAARETLKASCYAIQNLDITVICERPKLATVKARMISNIARLLALDVSQVNLKAKTHESVDAVGEGRAVEVHAVVLLLGIRD